MPFRESYAGCTSWVELDGLPDDPESLPSELALSDVAFAAKLKGAADAIPGGFAPPIRLRLLALGELLAQRRHVGAQVLEPVLL